MALHTFIEHNGQRLEITDAERVSEYSCDVCGQYLAAQQLATVNLQLRTPHHQAPPAFYEVHVSCMPKILDALARAIVEVSAQS